MARAWLIGRGFRRRWAALLPVALIVTIGATGALVALGAAERTANAYGRYVDRAHVGDVLVNPSFSTTDIDAVIRNLPGVQQVTSDALFMATLDEGEPRSLADERESPGPFVQVRGSVDGRYTAMDRPVFVEGRSFTGPAEAIVSESWRTSWAWVSATSSPSPSGTRCPRPAIRTWSTHRSESNT
jgi:hypothetical protein